MLQTRIKSTNLQRTNTPNILEVYVGCLCTTLHSNAVLKCTKFHPTTLTLPSTDRQTVRLLHCICLPSGDIKMVENPGIDPGTSHMLSERSTI